MDESADSREVLRSGPDFDVLELTRTRELARAAQLDPVGAALAPVDQP